MISLEEQQIINVTNCHNAFEKIQKLCPALSNSLVAQEFKGSEASISKVNRSSDLI